MKFGDISPAAGIMTGEGLMGDLAAKGGLGLLPAMIARDAQSDDEEKRKKAAGASSAPATATMKKGGKVSSASKRADGIATKGKTRGTMITMKTGGYAC
jgi:hypothetical protein